MKGLILTGGNPLSCGRLCRYAEEADFIVCADSGAENAYACNIMPDEIVGDFDSVKPEVLAFYRERHIQILDYPCSKDLTDTQLAAEICIEKGCTELMVAGATGDRTDHMMCNIWLLFWLRDNAVAGKIISETEMIFLCEKQTMLQAPVGTVVSFLPLTSEVTGVTLRGLEYPLNDYILSMARPISISNVFVSTTAIVEFKHGDLLAVVQN